MRNIYNFGESMQKVVLVFVFLILLSANQSYAQKHVAPIQVAIGTGDIQGGLYPIGITIGKILNINSKLHKLNPDVLATEGAVYNIDNVMNGELMLGIVETDVQYRAYKGLGEWEGMPQYDLRSIISIAPEYMQLVVSEDSKIKTLLDLEDKNINIGMVGEATHHNSNLILSSYGLDNDTVNFDNVSTSLKDTITMLQDGRLDGFFINSILPLQAIKQLSENTKIRMVDITGAYKLLLDYPDYKITTLHKSVYPKLKNPNNINTLSVMTSIVTSSKTSNYAAYIIAKEIVENLKILKTLHPAFKNLDIKEMLKYNTAPIHPGAMRYYTDKGLLN